MYDWGNIWISSRGQGGVEHGIFLAGAVAIHCVLWLHLNKVRRAEPDG